MLSMPATYVEGLSSASSVTVTMIVTIPRLSDKRQINDYFKGL